MMGVDCAEIELLMKSKRKEKVSKSDEFRKILSKNWENLKNLKKNAKNLSFSTENFSIFEQFSNFSKKKKNFF